MSLWAPQYPHSENYSPAKLDAHFPGLYFLGKHEVWNGKDIYVVKVGEASDIGKRMKSYLSHSPFFCDVCYIFNTSKYNDKTRKEFELNCHLYTGINALATSAGSNEWFFVTKEQYEYFCKCFSDPDAFYTICIKGRDMARYKSIIVLD